MADRKISDKQLIEALLLERDELYRRAAKAESLCAQLSDASAMRDAYETRIKEIESSHKAELSRKERAHADELAKAEKAHSGKLARTEKSNCEKLARMEADYKRQLSRKEEEIRQLIVRLEYMTHRLWGRMSERSRTPEDPLQLSFDFEGTELTDEERRQAEAAAETVKDLRRSVRVREHVKQVPVRRRLPDNLRREEVHVYPDGYPGHEDEWILFEATETSEHLEVTAPDMWVRVTVRHKAMRKSDNKIVTAAAPAEPLAKSYASASLLTELMIGKYADHLPFYRQIEMYKRLGVELRPPTIEAWFHGVADLMRPVYYRLREHMLKMDYLQSDESTVPVVIKEKHKTVKGYMWLARAVTEPLVMFHYHEGSRKKDVALQFFKDFKGTLQVDGYPVYDLLDKFNGVMVMCCWAHCRRYFERSLNHDKKRAEYAIGQIKLLYNVETIADGENASDERRARLRRELSYPIIRALEAWALNETKSVLPKSPMGKALGYLLRHIRQLSRYTLDGRYMIDNNLIENSVRPLALGRKNYLFCGNHDAAEDAAIVYTFMGCCKLAGVDVRKWMNYFLTHIHDYDGDYSRDLTELLPNELKKKKIL